MKNIITILFFVFIFTMHASAQEMQPFPVYYPEGVTGACPYFIWCDIYNERDKSGEAFYKIHVVDETGKEQVQSCKPALYKKYYYFKYPADILNGEYSYKIDRVLDNKPVDSKYYHSRKYPINGSFTVNKENKNNLDNLPHETLILYLSGQKKNKLINEYNAYFYGGASAGAFGIGMLFVTVLDFGIVSKVIAAIAFTSAACGAGASGYYAYQYFQGKDRLDKILEQSSNSFDNGKRYNAICKFNLKF